MVGCPPPTPKGRVWVSSPPRSVGLWAVVGGGLVRLNGSASDARSWRVEAIGKTKKKKINKEVDERPEHQNALKNLGKTIKPNGKPKQA